MRRKFTGIAATALLAMAAFGATSASAATEFGDNCVANEATESIPLTLFALTATGNPLPLTAPNSGVITKWKSSLIPVPVTVPQTLKVLRQTSPNTVQVVGESSGNIVGGLNTFDTRIPVQAGDRLGLFGPSPIGTLICELPGLNSLGVYEGGGSVGQTVLFIPFTSELRIPVAAIVEADADNDGFGDETQDQCPQLAAFQTACPVVTIDASARARKGSVSVLVTATSQAPVTVTGTVKLGKGKTAKLKGGTQVVLPGAIARFTLFLPKSVKAKLKDLSTKRTLGASIVATATDLVGRVSTDSLKVRLKGQKKPQPKKR
jgi:hypothetical protein